MNDIINEIKKILGPEVIFQPVDGYKEDTLTGLMAFKKGVAKFLVEDNCLTGLNLAETELSDEQWLDISKLIDLQQIKGLNLCANKLTHVVFNKGFQALVKLDLSDNTLESLHFEADCPVLKEINLENNQLKEFLLPEGAGFDQLLSVDVSNNPLSSTFEVVAKEGTEAFARFLRRLASQGVAESFEIKLLIVGEGETGKTTLWKYLLNEQHVPDPNQGSTVGIGIHEGWEFDHPDHLGTPYYVNLWDFGGQEIQYMTHQFFLTRRSAYILLADGRREVSNFPYWFKAINLLGTDQDAASKLPVLVVLNEKGSAIPKMPYDPATVTVDFPKLEVLKYEVDFGKRDARLKNLPAYIQELLSRRFPHLPLKIPSRWGAVRQVLQQLRNAEKRNYIDGDELVAICEKEGITDAQQRNDLSRLLHDLGIILHYQDVRYLHDFIILNPEWAVNAVYELLRHKTVKEDNQGRFDHQLLSRVWTGCGFTPKEQDGLLSLMLKDGFEVCFRAREKGKDIFIAPQLLPQNQPNDLNWSLDEVVQRFIYQYPFMPKGIIGRLIVRLHEHLESHNDQKVIWEKGMILAKNGCRAFILETDDVKTGLKLIKIEIAAPNWEDCKYLLRLICDQLDDIHHDSFPTLRVEKMIPCICNVCLTSADPYFYSLAQREEQKKYDIKTTRCGVAPFEEVRIENLLDGLLINESGGLGVHKSNVKKIFFSYSKADKVHLDALLKHLSGMRRSGKVEPWHDHLIKPGEEWDDTIKQNLAIADIIILFISPDFLATDYIWEVEIKTAMERHKRGKAVVIPVFVRPCDWKDMPFGGINGLPSDARAITLHSNPDTAWLEVAEGIKRVIS